MLPGLCDSNPPPPGLEPTVELLAVPVGTGRQPCGRAWTGLWALPPGRPSAPHTQGVGCCGTGGPVAAGLPGQGTVPARGLGVRSQKEEDVRLGVPPVRPAVGAPLRPEQQPQRCLAVVAVSLVWPWALAVPAWLPPALCPEGIIRAFLWLNSRCRNLDLTLNPSTEGHNPQGSLPRGARPSRVGWRQNSGSQPRSRGALGLAKAVLNGGPGRPGL